MNIVNSCMLFTNQSMINSINILFTSSLMMHSNVIVGITISRGSFVFSRVIVSASLTKRGVEQGGGKSPFSLLSEPISSSSYTFPKILSWRVLLSLSE